MDFRYKPGDKVRVINNFEAPKKYYMRSGPQKDQAYQGTGYVVVNDRRRLQGEIVTISRISNDRYKIEEDYEGWCWTDEMFVDSMKPFCCRSLL